MNRFISREVAVKKTPARLALRKRKRPATTRFQQHFDEVEEEEEDDPFHTKSAGSGYQGPISDVEKKEMVANAASVSYQTLPVHSVQKALSEGSTYRVKDVKQFETKFGPKQAWTMESKLSKQISRIWATRGLTKHTVRSADDATLDNRRANTIKSLDITYNGFTRGPGSKPRYDFTITKP